MGPKEVLLIFSARDDLMKVSWKSDAWKCQNQITLFTLTSWMKGTSPFQLYQDCAHGRASRIPASEARQLQQTWSHFCLACNDKIFKSMISVWLSLFIDQREQFFWSASIKTHIGLGSGHCDCGSRWAPAHPLSSVLRCSSYVEHLCRAAPTGEARQSAHKHGLTASLSLQLATDCNCTLIAQ